MQCSLMSPAKCMLSNNLLLDAQLTCWLHPMQEATDAGFGAYSRMVQGLLKERMSRFLEIVYAKLAPNNTAEG